MSAEARTIQTLFSFTIVWEENNSFELERAEIRVREKLQLMCKRTSVACYGEGDRGLPCPGSKSSTFWLLCDIMHVIEPLWTSASWSPQRGRVTTLSPSCLLKTQTGILSHKISLLLCPFLKAYGFLEFQSPVGKAEPGLVLWTLGCDCTHCLTYHGNKDMDVTQLVPKLTR